MASYQNVKSRVVLRLNGGIGENGKPVIKTVPLGLVRGDIGAEDLHQVSQALGGLLELPVLEVLKQDTDGLVA
ncbi:Protein of unknown function (DUF1659) [Thermanaerovibrio velox DSM 12556]|uniref:DUF1659 domain-containing protein n=1 Tax=Thermanaerovibrio velox DSM 12556 TaxID=926567 RepID=H0UQK5_9BACT|nr:DUF1659 domain-containing protein [Thermanaerovibrio velox]EHM10769.1 Protein of unknown function (DUF1659) [Thermanaerovibrio velox DSM 12556]